MTLIELLNKLDQALYYWQLTCDPDSVDIRSKLEISKDIMAHGGTLAYIDELRMDMRLFEAEQRNEIILNS